MIVKTFTGPSLRDVLQSVRDSFGADAVILDTQFDRRERNRSGQAAGDVSVTAAYEPETTRRQEIAPAGPLLDGPKTLHVKGDLSSIEPEEGHTGAEWQATPSPMPESVVQPDPVQEQLGLAIQVLAEAAGEFRNRDAGAAVWNSLHKWLATQPQLATGVIDTFAGHLTESIPPLEPFLNLRPKGQKVLVVGDRGVGKSTALFKALAARWKMCQRRPTLRVISESSDDGHERLAAVCNACDVEFDTHTLANGRLSPGRVGKAADSFTEYVPGRPDSDFGLRAKSIRRAIKPDAVVLILNAAGAPQVWRSSYARFAPFDLTHVIFTHWDEHQPWWDVVSFARRHAVLLAYHSQGFEPLGEIDPFTTADLRSGVAAHVAGIVGGETSSLSRGRESK
jgi:hypothetical protein